MEETKIKAETVRSLSILYKVSWKTMKKWLKNHESYIGERIGSIYNPDQVARIYERLGNP